MEDGNYLRYLPLLKAALNGDWITANRFFQEDPTAVTSSISNIKETALHAAISTGSSCDFIRKLVEIMPVDSLALRNKFGNNALHYAAIAGHTDAAKILVEKNPRLTLERNNTGVTPVLVASENAHKETVLYLLSVTLDEHPSPFHDAEGVRLLNSLIVDDFYGIAIDLLKRKPMLSGKSIYGVTALDMLAKKCYAFVDGRSGSGRFKQLLIQITFGFVQDTQKRQAKELLTLLISEAYKVNPSIADHLLGHATLIAAQYRTHELESL